MDQLSVQLNASNIMGDTVRVQEYVRGGENLKGFFFAFQFFKGGGQLRK